VRKAWPVSFTIAALILIIVPPLSHFLIVLPAERGLDNSRADALDFLSFFGGLFLMFVGMCAALIAMGLWLRWHTSQIEHQDHSLLIK